jgi:hypothetical protein
LGLQLDVGVLDLLVPLTEDQSLMEIVIFVHKIASLKVLLGIFANFINDIVESFEVALELFLGSLD